MIAAIAAIKRFWPLAACIAAFAAGWAINGWRWEAKQVDALQAAQKARIEAEAWANEVSSGLETKIAAIERSRNTLARRLDRETRNPGYDCPVPANGLRLLHDALSGTESPGQPDGTVP